MKSQPQLTFSLFFLRLTVALVMLGWNLDKFINPEHAATVYEKFYLLGGLDSGAMYATGSVEIVIVATWPMLAACLALYLRGIRMSC